jgi:lipopolysaccharide/colanic/teichoic acid biosynthesis glycosyltransferase
VTLGLFFEYFGRPRKICFLTSEEESGKVLKAFRAQRILRYFEPVSSADLSRAPGQRELAWIVISRAALHRFEKNEAVLEAMLSGQELVDYRELMARLNGRLEIDSLDLWSFLNEASHRSTSTRIYESVKIVLERFLSAFLLVALLPFFLLVAIAVKATSPGPVFYGQTRLGYRGQSFVLWKFRSMRQDAEAGGPRWATHGDPRITSFGTFLRKTRIDELPQLWNIIRGEMSLIGPRPERPEFYRQLEEKVPLFRFRLLMRPGITGWAQVMGGYAATLEQTKRKLGYDLFYLQRMSPRMDVIIALRTLAVAFRLSKA